jgi:ribosome-associated protein
VAAPKDRRVKVAPEEVEFVALRSQGPGGQNVNKVSSAVQLRFDIAASSLPAHVKERLLALADQRLTRQGVLVIKAQSSRSQEQNKADAMDRLNELVAEAAKRIVPRKPTKPTYGSKLRRLEAKTQRSSVKASRGKVQE